MIISLIDSPPEIKVDITEIEKADKVENHKKFNMKTFYTAAEQQQVVPLFDPSTLDHFGDILVTSPTEVNNIVDRAKIAQEVNIIINLNIFYKIIIIIIIKIKRNGRNHHLEQESY
jgi:hypothetical protein